MCSGRRRALARSPVGRPHASFRRWTSSRSRSSRRAPSSRATSLSERTVLAPPSHLPRRAAAEDAPASATPPPARAMTGVSGASASVFHSEHAGHWPNQRGLSLPHAVQNQPRATAFEERLADFMIRLRQEHSPGNVPPPTILPAAMPVRRGACLLPAGARSPGPLRTRRR